MAPMITESQSFIGAELHLEDGLGKSGTQTLPSKKTHEATSSYTIREVPLNTLRPMRIVCAGGAYAAMMMAIVVHEKMNVINTEFVIYERNTEFGGTWFENRYPGCQCDIPAHNYSYSFEANPDWPNYYATAPQILAYMKKVKAKYQLDPYWKFSHEVKGAIWSEEKGKWELKVQHGDTTFDDECDVFIQATGNLNNWKYPDIDGLLDFKGKLLHSAAWDKGYDFEGKRVAVIGIGSSAVQIVPKLAPIVKNLTSFIRSKTWISPTPGINEPTASDPEMDEKLNFAPHELERFKRDPEYLLHLRRAISDRRMQNFGRSVAASELQANAQSLFRRVMKERLGNSEKGRRLAELIIPDYPIGCRRQTPGPNYLESLVRDNVDTKWDDIERITERGIMTRSGEELEFDAIVCATGFRTSFQPRFPVIGRGGASLGKQYDNIPEAYFGMTTPNFPNFFTMIGPNSPISNGSLILSMQIVSIYIYKFVMKLQTESIKSLEISLEATKDFNEHVQEYLKRTVWTGSCRSWYKRGTVDGPVVAIYGGTTFHFIEAIKNPRWEDYLVKYLPKDKDGGKVNRFAYLGNGYTKREAKGGSVGEVQTLNFEEFWHLFVLPSIYD